MRALLLLMMLPFLVGAPHKRSDIVKFVKEHFPNKVSKLDAILDRYSGKEDKLMKKLLKERLQLVVHTHYSKFKPQAIDQVESVVKTNLGKENELIMNLDRKEKSIAKWKKKIVAAYKALGMNKKLVEAGIDQLMQAHYGKESKLLKKVQQESSQFASALLSGANGTNSTATDDDLQTETPVKAGGDVIVFGQAPGELHADKMGIYQIQTRRVGGRPLYKLLRNTPSGLFQSSQSLRFYLFYVESSTQWLIGPEQHIGANSGWLYVIDQASSPEFIKSQWNILDGMGRNWLPAPLVEVVPATDENKWQYLFQQEHIAEANTFLGITALSTLAILCGLLWVVYRFVIPPFWGVWSQAGGFANSFLTSFQRRSADNVATQLAREEKKKKNKKEPKQPAHQNQQDAASLRKRKGKKSQEEESAQPAERRTSEPKKKGKGKGNKESTASSTPTTASTHSKDDAPYTPYTPSYYVQEEHGPGEEEIEQQQHAEALARLRLKQALKREDTAQATLWMNLVQNGSTQQILDALANGKNK